MTTRVTTEDTMTTKTTTRRQYAVFHTDGIATMDRLTTHDTLAQARRARWERVDNAWTHGATRKSARSQYLVRAV